MEYGAATVDYSVDTNRYDERILDTDIVLAASDTSVTSVIRRPTTAQDSSYWAAGSTTKNWNSQFFPQMIIKGGTIDVQSGQNLEIQGTVDCTQAAANTLSPTPSTSAAPSAGTVPTLDTKVGDTVSGTDLMGRQYSVTIGQSLNNMNIAPDKIIVESGATLTLDSTTSQNVFTDIYCNGGSVTFDAGAQYSGTIYVGQGGTVTLAEGTSGAPQVTGDIYIDGGTLIVQSGAYIAGNIYCYGNGTVNVQGAFTLDAHTTTGTDNNTYPGGIFIYGPNDVAPGGDTALGQGTFEAGNLYAITGTDGENTILDSHIVHFLAEDPSQCATSSNSTFKGLVVQDYCCSDASASGQCEDYQGSTSGSGWLLGTYANN
jgi:hypothetical protein